MEYRKEYGSPRDMLDDTMLRQVLTEMDTGDGCRYKSRMGKEEMSENRCSCQKNRGTGDGERCVSGNGAVRSGMPLAMVYAPDQPWEGIQEPEAALASGTLFTGLLFPWYPSQCGEKKSCGCGRN